MGYIIRLFPVFALLLISACKSPLSKGEADELSAIGAKVEIFQNLTDKKDNNVTVSLFDSHGKTISNKNITLKVNGVALDFKEKQELYYVTTTTYTKSNLPVIDAFRFEIILTDGKSYVLGNVKPLSENNEKDIVCNEKGNFNEDFVISWSNLKEINEISISKSVLLSTSTQTEQYYDYEPVITKKIESSGRYIIPKSGYINSTSTISGLEIKFNAIKSGDINTSLLDDSEIKIYGYIDKRINYDEQSKH